MALMNPYQQYRQQQVATAPQDKLLLMLYDGAIRFCHQAKRAVQNKDAEAAHANLVKAQNIILELMDTLNMDFQVAHDLYSLYDYFYRQLIEANMKKDTTIIDEVLVFISDLRKTWAEAAAIVKSEGRVSGFEGNYSQSGVAPDGPRL